MKLQSNSLKVMLFGGSYFVSYIIYHMVNRFLSDYTDFFAIIYVLLVISIILLLNKHNKRNKLQGLPTEDEMSEKIMYKTTRVTFALSFVYLTCLATIGYLEYEITASALITSLILTLITFILLYFYFSRVPIEE